jgi:hypothetical protein
MSQNSIRIVIAIFVLVVIGMFVFAYVQRSRVNTAANEEPATSTPQTPYDSITHVDAKHFYIDGTHTVAGEIEMPTPCDLLQATSSVDTGVTPQKATIDFSVINNAESCAQVVTPARFLVSFDADDDAAITATFMGRPIELNLIPAAEGETPEDFELYLKG